MLRFKRLAPLAAAAVLLVAPGCSDSATGPGSVNTTTLLGDVNGLTSTFSANAAFQSLATLANAFPQYAAAAARRALLPASIGALPAASVGSLQRMLAAVQGRRAAVSAIARAPGAVEALFPIDVLGKTLVWDPDSLKYVVGAGITGAPATGIRIRLYTIDPNTLEPAAPLTQLGYVDLTDESTAQANRLGVLLKLGSSTIADYTISAIVSTSTEELDAAGYIVAADGTGRVDFDLAETANLNTNSLHFVYTLTAQSGAQVLVDLLSNADDTGSATFRISHGGNSIEIDVTGTAAGSSGQVKFNGVVVATISGTDTPVFTAVSGHTLSASQIQDLEDLFVSVGDAVLGVLGGVFGPAIVVFSGF